MCLLSHPLVKEEIGSVFPFVDTGLAFALVYLKVYLIVEVEMS